MSKAAVASARSEAYKIISIPGKGEGAIATRDIPEGTVLLRDAPLLILRASELGRTDIRACGQEERFTKTYTLVQKKFDALDDDAKARYVALADSETDSDITQMWLQRVGLDASKVYHRIGSKSPQGIWGTNCHTRDDGSDQAIYPIICKFNHSCRPNAIFQWREVLDCEVVLTSRSIKEGEEICVSYFDSRMKTRRERQEHSLLAWGFECRCEACDCGESDALAQIDAGTPAEDLIGEMSETQAASVRAALATARKSDTVRRLVETCNKKMFAAQSYADCKILAQQMLSLYSKEKLTPNIVYESSLAFDLLQYAVMYNAPAEELRAHCAAYYEKIRLLKGDSHEDSLLAAKWSQKPPSKGDLQAEMKKKTSGGPAAGR